MVLVSAMMCLATVGPTLGANFMSQCFFHSGIRPIELKQDNELSNIYRFYLLTSPVYKHRFWEKTQGIH